MKTSFFAKIFLGLCAAVCAGGLSAARAEAAALSLRASSIAVHQTQEIALDVVLDPEGETLNAVSAELSIPPNLSFQASGDSNSIIGLWVDRPTYVPETRTVYFSGIIPGGFSGLIDPFAPGGSASGGVLARLYLIGAHEGVGTISFGSVSAYLDGTLGAETTVRTKPLSIVVDKLFGNVPLTVSEDTEPPLAFTPLIVRDVLLYGGKRVLVWDAKDKGSGIDHYEVQEGTSGFVVAESPYLLHDQSISGDIVIKAIDRAGNVQYATIKASHGSLFGKIALGVLGLLAVLIALSFRKKKIDLVIPAPLPPPAT